LGIAAGVGHGEHVPSSEGNSNNRAPMDWNSAVPGFGSGSLDLSRLAAFAGHACP